MNENNNISTREDLVLKLQDFSSYIAYDVSNLEEVKKSDEFDTYVDIIKTAMAELCPDDIEEKFNVIIESLDDIDTFDSDEFEASISEICRDIEAISYRNSNEKVIDGIYVDPEVDVHFVATGEKENISPTLSPLSNIPNTPLSEMNIRFNILRALRRYKITTLRELMAYDINELKNVRIPSRVFVEIVYNLDENGYRLKGCEREKYATINDYIADEFTCVHCDQKLDANYETTRMRMCQSCHIKSLTKTLSEIRANKADYFGKHYLIADEIQLTYNQCARKAFYGVSLGEQIELFYDKCEIADKLLMIIPRGNKVKVSGVIKKYSNSDDFYIDIDKIEGLDDALKIVENQRILNSNDDENVCSLRQILANPNRYKGNYVKIREQLTVTKNDKDTQMITARISIGKELYEYEVYNSIDIYTSSETKSTGDLWFDPYYEKIQVEGIVSINDATSNVYIEAKSITFVKKFSLPEASIKMLLAYPKRYAEQKVRIIEKLVVYSNNAKRKSFQVYQSLGEGKFQYNSQNKIEIFYEKSKQIDNCIMIDPDYQKITVEGYLRKYNNSEDYYIDGTNIKIDFLK